MQPEFLALLTPLCVPQFARWLTVAGRSETLRAFGGSWRDTQVAELAALILEIAHALLSKRNRWPGKFKIMQVKTIPGRREKDTFSYDFGDSWQHKSRR
jgi:hypothetical protein